MALTMHGPRDVGELYKKFTLLHDYIAIKFGLDFEDFCMRRAKAEKRNPKENNDKNSDSGTEEDSCDENEESHGGSNTANSASKRRSKGRKRKRSSKKPSSTANNVKKSQEDDGSSESEQEASDLPTSSFQSQQHSMQLCEPQSQSTYPADPNIHSLVEVGGNPQGYGHVGSFMEIGSDPAAAARLAAHLSKSKPRQRRKLSKAERKTPLILQGPYFKIVVDVGDDMVTAECQKCDPPKLINGSYKSTTNFRTHLKRIHPAALTEYLEILEQHKREALRLQQMKELGC